jgi:hypothetical protein
MAEENNNNSGNSSNASEYTTKEGLILKANSDAAIEYEKNLKKSTEASNKFAKSQKDVSESTKDATEKLADFTLVQEALGKTLTNVLFFTERVESATKSFGRSVSAVAKKIKNFYGSFDNNAIKLNNFLFETLEKTVGKKLPTALKRSTAAALRLGAAFAATGIGAIVIAITALALAAKQFVTNFIAIDKAAANVAQTSGILSSNISQVITEAAQFDILGGNMQLVADAINSLTANFSAAIRFTKELAGNTADVALRFGLSAENAAKLIEVISATQDLTLNQAAKTARSFIEDLGAIGPAIIKNLVEGYDEVVTNFGLSEKSLIRQATLATRLGLTLSQTADIAKSLLDFQTSIPAEFELSVRLGRQLNFNEARRLAIVGKTAEATEEVIRQLGAGRDLTKLTFFDAQAIQQATGLTVAELVKQQKIQKAIQRGDRIDEKTRISALGNIELITNRIRGTFFRIFASPPVTRAIENLVNQLNALIDSDTFQQTIQNVASYIQNIADYIANAKNIEQLVDRFSASIRDILIDAIFGIPSAIRQRRLEKKFQSPTYASGGRFGMRPQRQGFEYRGPRMGSTQQISTDPSQITKEQNQQNQMASILKDATDSINNLAKNGITANTYLDGKKVSTGVAKSSRYS